MPYPRPAADPLDVCTACGHTRECHHVARVRAHGAVSSIAGDVVRGNVDADCDAHSPRDRASAVCASFSTTRGYHARRSPPGEPQGRPSAAGPGG